MLVLGLLLFSFGHLRLWSPAFPERFAQVVYWTSLPISLLGIAQALVPGKLDFGLQALGKMAAFSTLGNPQFVAVWLVWFAPRPNDFFLPEIKRVFKKLEIILRHPNRDGRLANVQRNW